VPLAGWKRVAGERLHASPSGDPHAYALYFYTEPGDHIGWHYHTSYYAGRRYTLEADVLYQERIMAALVEGDRPANRLLIDRDFGEGEEPVKVCVRDGKPIELRKRLAPGLQHDTIGESVGFFRLDEPAACRLAQLVAGYIDGRGADLPHEEAVRDLLQEGSHSFEVIDVTGVPWIEIDFAADVLRAEHEVLPRLHMSIPRGLVTRVVARSARRARGE
jgi:choline kinase